MICCMLFMMCANEYMLFEMHFVEDDYLMHVVQLLVDNSYELDYCGMLV